LIPFSTPIPPRSVTSEQDPEEHAETGEEEHPGIDVAPGQTGLAPPHRPAVSHALAADAQTVPAGDKPSAGQLTEEPVHVSATSQPPAFGRHVVVDGANRSTGHVAEDPVHASATSQMPALALQP
jgi:hypothetical protein